MKLFAPAKINLYLRIEGRRDDGYHLLDTLMVPISLGDDVEITRSEGAPGSIAVRADDPAVPVGEDNTVHRAARAFQDRTDCREPVAVSIRKRIPMGAGLGGGSTDAAAALRGMNDLFDAGLSAEDLEALALTVGADVPFFIRGAAARAPRHRERQSPAGAQPPRWLVVVLPGIPV
ncbi:MAG: 4-(cytidine 5'-diphospho)-2-C-methyl-D-erythritol kinase, partial [Deltaproteobacteria bacterium]|nr:4-(cytidine 5'-diphospho)-2-C-methyl-D-erythritol kinase [Deltaproteobacteria bacterium]